MPLMLRFYYTIIFFFVQNYYLISILRQNLVYYTLKTIGFYDFFPVLKNGGN
jgi:hypothetical protein